MKSHPALTNKSYLIWLISVVLLLSPGMGSGNASTTPLRHFKQTELILSGSDQKTKKRSRFVTQLSAKPASSFSFSLGASFHSLINWHTEAVELKWKSSKEHLISTSPKIGQAHHKIAVDTDEHTSSLQG
jgi:hypothetical protein